MSKNDLRKKVDFDIFYLIYTYIRKNSSFALILTFFNSVIFRVPDPYMFQKIWLKVSKNDLRKKVDFDIFYLIYTYIRKNSSFALILTFFNSVIFRVPVPYMFQKYG